MSCVMWLAMSAERFGKKDSKDKNKDVMFLCVLELSGDEDNEERGTEKWTNELNRGGLWHISDLACSLFYAMEQVLRSSSPAFHGTTNR